MTLLGQSSESPSYYIKLEESRDKILDAMIQDIRLAQS
jgi:hypothetical protein